MEDLNNNNLENIRSYYIKMKNEARNNNNIDDYIKFQKLYNNITSKIHHLKNKEDEEYKKKKYEAFKRYLNNNTEYYERIKEKNRIRSNNNYISKKDLKNKIYNNIENE